jgi:hypothetical protein
MRTKVELGLAGAFKVDLYKDGKLTESTDWFSNFITHTGLNYPAIYPFIDCFRYLSLGTDNSTPNTGYGVSETPTTGLNSPIVTLNATSGAQRGTYIGWEGYEVGGDGQESACGTTLTESGPRFFRAWTIPTGGVGNVMAADVTIGEFMVSPSSGSDPVGRCAFSRVQRNLSIPKGYKAVVSYQLKINIPSGRTPFGVGNFATGNADITNDESLVADWYNLSGYYRQVYHGLMCIDKRGNSFVPKYGAIMEPCLNDLSDSTFYLSPDNAAFDVNNKDGGNQTNEDAAYASDGLMKNILNIPMSWDGIDDFENLSYEAKKAYYEAHFTDATKIQADFPENLTPKNIRLGSATSYLQTPSVRNYYTANSEDLGTDFTYQKAQDATLKEISFATPGASGIDTQKVNFGQKAVFSTRVFRLPFDFNTTARRKTLTRRTLFSPVSSLGNNSRFASLVYGYAIDNNGVPNRTIYPTMDCLFYDSSGQSMMQHYRVLTVEMTNRGSGIAESFINILPTGENIQRFRSAKTIHGEIAGGEFVTDVDPINYLTGVKQNTSGDYTFDGGVGYSGWGAVIGVVATGFSQYPFDCGLTNHNISIGAKPSTTSTIYWPTSRGAGASGLRLQITGIKYYSSLGCYQDYESQPTASGQGSYPWASNPCKFHPPTGRIIHFENFGSTGFRLLPNHGIANNRNENTYPIAIGGRYPALSFDNGLELNLDISWSAPCPAGVVECTSP